MVRLNAVGKLCNFMEGGMHRVKIVAIGKVKEKWMAEAIGEYAKRLGRFCRFEVAEVSDERIDASGGAAGSAGIERGLRREGDRALARLAADAYVAVADVAGETLGSEGFAERLRATLGQGQELTFVVGGSHGLHADVLARSDWRFSMSRMTFPHQLARLMLVEQIYRAFKIISNETYHK
jgi:23S rRNA (pseudouridine1915-N3)-methyltransferase